MAETKHATTKTDAAQTPRDIKATAKGTASTSRMPASTFSAAPHMNIWDFASDEVSATVLAELRL